MNICKRRRVFSSSPCFRFTSVVSIVSCLLGRARLMSDHAPVQFSRFAKLCLLGAAIAQAVAAIVFFYAANWWGMAPALKVGLIYGALILCAVLAALAAPHSFARSGMVVAGCVLSGILFLVHGQIWQTGASAWELFALWTALSLFWALLSESDGAWVITAIVGTTATLLWIGQTDPDIPVDWISASVSLFLTFILGARWLTARRSDAKAPAAWLVVILIAAILGIMTFGAIIAFPALLPSVASFVLFAVVMAALPLHRAGPWPFSLALICTVILLEALIVRKIFDLSDVLSTGTLSALLLVVSVFLLGSMAGLSIFLHRLFAKVASFSEAVQARLHSLISVAVGIGAWIAVGVAASGWGGLLSLMDIREDYAGLAIAIPAALLAIAIREKNSFTSHARAAFITLAYGGVIAHIGLNNVQGFFNIDHALVLMAAAAVVILPALLMLSRNRATGAVGTLIMLVLIVGALFAHQAPVVGMIVWVPVWAMIGWLLLRAERGSIRAAGVVLLLAAFVFPAFIEFSYEQRWITDTGSMLYFTRGVAALTALGLLWVVSHMRPELREPRLLIAAALTLGASLLAPAGLAGLVGLGAVATVAVGRPLLAMAFVIAAWSLGKFYYDLTIPLDSKALALAIGAALTIVAWLLIRKAPWSRPVLRPAPLILLSLCALVPIVIELIVFTGQAEVANKGTEAFLPLRPVDPRSLLQGDYMELAYDIENENLTRYGGPAYLLVDENGVALSIRAADGTPKEREIPLKTHKSRDYALFAPDSFLFQEGTAETWGKAKYAIVRIHDGALVMTGLADESRQKLQPPPVVKGAVVEEGGS